MDEVRPSCYTFDPFDPHVLAIYGRQAKLHAFLGQSTELQKPVATTWIPADRVGVRLGDSVPSEVVDLPNGSNGFVLIGDQGVVCVDGQAKLSSASPPPKLPSKLGAAAALPSTFARSGFTSIHSSGRSYLDFRAAVGMMRLEGGPQWTDGPRAVSECLEAILAERRLP